MQTNESGTSCRPELDAILASGLPDMPKLAQAFEALTGFIIEATERQIELARAMRDDREAVKQQIKLETLKHARSIFQTCYLGVTGKAARDDQTWR
jgi:hypothetical protein